MQNANVKYKKPSLVDSLVYRSMQYNYIEFVKFYDNDFDEADKGMARIFGQSWEAHKEEIWQWYDWEVSDEKSNS